jgi:Ala-tRNA(Pro) deacylase
MAIATTLQHYLDDQRVPYDLTTHDLTGSSARTAEASHVSAENVAKGVVIKHKDGFVLAILPATRQVELDALGTFLNGPVCLATEEEVGTLFPDCGQGAVPPLPGAYGLSALIDESLEGRNDIYFEGGDHTTLVHIAGSDFHRLMEKVPHKQFCAGGHGSPQAG